MFLTLFSMVKDFKSKITKDSFIPSDCSVLAKLREWSDSEKERLASKGKDITKFKKTVSQNVNVGTIYCEDYTLKFNLDECVIDLVINIEKDSSIWDDVIENVPARFAQYLGNPETFVYGLSTTKSKEKWYYSFKRDDKESGTLFPTIGFTENPITLNH